MIPDPVSVISGIDLWLFHAVNGWCGYWPLDWLVAFAERNNLAKGALILAAYWWLWFSDHPGHGIRRRLVGALAGALVALALARILAAALPFRIRPMYQGEIGFIPPQLPPFSHPIELEGWSSFPSDHAALFFALATGLWRCSRPLGGVALVFAAIWVCLVRIYLGIHFPSDILAGALIGTASALIASGAAEGRAGAWIVKLEQNHPAWFYAALFLLTYEFATMFEDVRQVMHGSAAVLHVLRPHSIGILVMMAALLGTVVIGAGWLLFRRSARVSHRSI